jgi:phosphoglycerate kinase
MTARPAALAGLPLLEDLGDVAGKRVLVRSDLNVPLTQRDGTREVADDFRIRQAVPTLKWLQDHGATVVCCTHVGRPHGQEVPELSVAPIAAKLAEYIDGIDVLENLRFDPREEGNDPSFVAELVDGFDCYVNDAFGASHRAHASVVGPPRTLPSAAGRLLEREVEVLGGLLVDPKRPFVAIVGGAKVADKLGVVRSLCEKADAIVVGGGMAFTFLAAQGRDVGASMLDESRIDECAELLHGSTPILLPTDVVALSPGGTFGDGDRSGEVDTFEGDIPNGWMGLDIGPQSAERYASEILSAQTVLWNGPMGVFEDPRFAEGTRIVGRAVADGRGTSVVGGGDSAMAAEQFGFAEKIDFMSTGGGASLEFIEYGDLPALEALRHAQNAPEAS